MVPTNMTNAELRATILRNPELKSVKTKAAALYGATCALAFTGNVARAKEFAQLCGVRFEGAQKHLNALDAAEALKLKAPKPEPVAQPLVRLVG